MKLQRTQRRRDRLGFTLMEVLVVVAILVILAGTASIFIFRYLDDAKIDRGRADLQTVTNACMSYKLKNGEFPQSLMQLLDGSDGNRQPYLNSNDAIKDPWGRDFIYNPEGPNHQGLKPDISFTDPDGNVIGNWETVQQGKNLNNQ